MSLATDTPAKPSLGVCYYPEHWPETGWDNDAKRMAALGLKWVRIGEFAWSKLEPSEGDYQLDWLRRAIETLRAHDLNIVLGTPTATPPRWMIDKYPDMIATDAQGQPRKFGSRRHYSFSHSGYREECKRITAILAQTFGDCVQAWQTDNEYGCHDTVRSYGPYDRAAFHVWLREKYGDIETLNQRWGNQFWSMDYPHFAQIDLPNLTVTEANPAHRLDFDRFCSDQVVRFNAAQTDIIRQHSDAPISHNYMGRITDFDHFDVGADCDFATWDSYPLGFLEDRVTASESHRDRYAQQGDPDFQAFHHDLYRSVGRGRWWVMEQQPGPVNWAPYNPAPLPGMVRAWSWEAFAHGAETVAFFRWRQAPFAQEQMHAGLLRCDGSPAEVWPEIAALSTEIETIDDVTTPAKVAIIFDYESCWAWDIQPQGQGFSHFDTVFQLYRALRRKGLSIDIIPPTTDDLSDHALVIIPALFTIPDILKQAMDRFEGTVLLGPRTNSKTQDFLVNLAPVETMDMRVSAAETFRPTRSVPVSGGGAFTLWRERIETSETVILKTDDGWPALIQRGSAYYLCGLPDETLMERIITQLCKAAHVDTETLPPSVRRRDRGSLSIYINYGPDEQILHDESLDMAGIRLVRRDR